MTTITKERIELFVKSPLENGLTRGEQMELARIALEALTAEPVAEVRARYPLGIDGGKQKFIQVTGELPDFGGHLYAAPPAPVSVPDGLKQAVEFYEQVNQENIPVETGAWKDAVNWVLEEACRATMLQANQRDLSQPVDPQVAKYEQIMLRAGLVMVPVEPTDEMIAAAMECEDVLFNSDGSFCVQFREIYCAMVTAAPKPEGNSK
ncbi:TPA: hypothetical protein H1Q11_003584 [Salmonella enterica]|nr:hypothetical protein [Salmonella enterica]